MTAGPVAWGLLSTARINRPVLAGARASERADVIAVASRDGGRAEAYAREHGIERAYASYDALLEDRDVEAVYIPLPNALHIEWTLLALAAGKHVLCEKPLARRASQAAEAFDLADRHGLVLSEGFMWRHNPQTHALARLVAEGVVGQLRMIRVAFSFQLVAVHGVDDARFDPQLEGGSLMDVGCYCVNAIRLLGGEPERVYAEQARGPTGVDVVFVATLRLPGDVVAHFDCGFVTPDRDELEVVGDQATLFLDDPWQNRLTGIELRREAEPRTIEVERIAVERADSYQLELENVSDAIRGEAPLLLGRDDALGQARVIEALHESATSGAPVDLEPVSLPANDRST